MLLFRDKRYVYLGIFHNDSIKPSDLSIPHNR